MLKSIQLFYSDRICQNYIAILFIFQPYIWGGYSFEKITQITLAALLAAPVTLGSLSLPASASAASATPAGQTTTSQQVKGPVAQAPSVYTESAADYAQFLQAKYNIQLPQQLRKETSSRRLLPFLKPIRLLLPTKQVTVKSRLQPSRIWTRMILHIKLPFPYITTASYPLRKYVPMTNWALMPLSSSQSKQPDSKSWPIHILKPKQRRHSRNLALAQAAFRDKLRRNWLLPWIPVWSRKVCTPLSVRVAKRVLILPTFCLDGCWPVRKI